MRAFLRDLYTQPGIAMARPQALSLIADARRAGVRLGALTNDLAVLGPPEARRTIPFLADLDVIVDGSVNGVLKPDPRAYLIAAEQLGVPPPQVVFLDDLPGNVAGARAVGMTAYQVRLESPAEAFDAARRVLGL